MVHQSSSEEVSITTHDFAKALDESTSAKGTDKEFPDEEKSSRPLHTRIVREGLMSIYGKADRARVLIIGAGAAGLSTAYELKRAGMDVSILEVSQRVGGRIKTFWEPFTKGLHSEGGAMRLPTNHWLVHEYLKHFKMQDQLEPFTQANKLIYLSGYGKILTYNEFNRLLLDQDEELLRLFPRLKPAERGKTIDMLWDTAVQPVLNKFYEVYTGTDASVGEAWSYIMKEYDRYSLRTYFEEIAGWSSDCILLYDLGSAHVVLSNGFMESFGDSFLSSEEGGTRAGMQQMKGGMEQIPLAFLDSDTGTKLKDDIRYGCKVVAANKIDGDVPGNKVEVIYETIDGRRVFEQGDYVVFAIPFTALRMLKVSPTFSPTKTNTIRELRYVQVTKILIQFKTRWWEDYLSRLGQGTDGGVVTDLPIRYVMFPISSSEQFAHGQNRGVVMVSYTFEQDATELGALNEQDKMKLASNNLATIFGEEVVCENIEVGISQVWSADPLSGGSAFAYFGPGQRARLYKSVLEPDWDNRAHFAGEHASLRHGWIQGAFESGLRVADLIYRSQRS